MGTFRPLALALISGLLAANYAFGAGTVESNESETTEGNDPRIEVEHEHGTLELDEEPQRIVSVGYSDHDVLLALGIEPVGVREWYGGYPFATWPWAQDALGDAEPEIVGDAELDLEQIAALDPDLIVGVNTAMSESEFDLLSQIAPTLGPSRDYPEFGTPWDAKTELIADAVGQSEQGAEVISEIESRLEQVRQENPEFSDAEIAVAFNFDGDVGAYASRDVRSRLMEQLGFEIPERYDELAGDSFFASFSEEEIQLLDRDLILWIGASDADIERIRELSLRDQLAAVDEGREIFAGTVLGGAFSFASPLSIPYLLDELVPALAAAVDGDPGTEVPEGLQ